MKKRIRDDIKRVLEQVLKALDASDAARIARLSNHTIHNASIYQDEFSLTCAVVVYAIGKLHSRCAGDCKVMGVIRKHVEAALRVIDNENKFKKALQNITKSVAEFDSRYKFFVEEVVYKARVKKGSNVYKHGISLGRAADILKVSRWDLQNYIGKTSLIDADKERASLRKRYAYVKKVLK